MLEISARVLYSGNGLGVQRLSRFEDNFYLRECWNFSRNKSSDSFFTLKNNAVFAGR